MGRCSVKALVLLCLLLSISLINGYTTVTPPGGASEGNRGSWVFCEKGYFVKRMRALYEDSHWWHDDTGLNKIEIECCRCDSASTCKKHKSTGENWGDWRDWKKCDSGGFVRGMRMKTEFNHHTGLNAVEFQCTNGDKHQTNRGEAGSWRGWKSCPAGQHMMGIKLIYEKDHAGDDSGGNTLQFACSGACCGDGKLVDEELRDDDSYCDAITKSGDAEQDSWNAAACKRCKVQNGYDCKRITADSGHQTSQCFPVCGDAYTVPDERTFGRCEDHNTRSGDGCDSNCYIEPGWICRQQTVNGRETSVCTDANEEYKCDSSFWHGSDNQCYLPANIYNYCGALATTVNEQITDDSAAFRCQCEKGAVFLTETADAELTVVPVPTFGGKGSYSLYTKNKPDLELNLKAPYLLFYGSKGNNVSLHTWGCSDIKECLNPALSRCEKGAFRDYAPGLEPVQCQEILQIETQPHHIGYSCSCAEGFGYLAPDADHTRDVLVAATCEDEECSSGALISRYNPDNVGFRCWDINRCAHPEVYGGVCPATALCRNILAAAGEQCECPVGYDPVYTAGVLTDCVDKDECRIKDYCGENSICENVVGSVNCRCAVGYRREETTGVCVPVNPCTEAPITVLCGSVDARCVHTGPGTYMCESNPQRRRLRRGTREYVRKGFNLCSNPNACGKHALCSYEASEGYHTCACPNGFVGNPYTACEERTVDYQPSCARNNGGCGLHAACSRAADGNFECTCDEGFVDVGGECVLDPDREIDCPPNAICTVLDNGAVAVVCKEGFVVEGYEFAQANVSAIFADFGSRQCIEPNPCAYQNGRCGDNMDCHFNSSTRQVSCECSEGYFFFEDECQPAFNAEAVKEHMQLPCDYACIELLAEYYEELGIIESDILTANCAQQCVDTFNIYYGGALATIFIANKQLSYNFTLEPSRVYALAALMPDSHIYSMCDMYGYVDPTPAQEVAGYAPCSANLDECFYAAANGLSLCGDHANCIDTVGSFYCECKAGTSGSGNGHCKDIDECRYGCGEHGVCYNHVGQEFSVQDMLSTSCRCDPGYKLNPSTLQCEDVDECEASSGGCNENADCTNTPGSHLCTCKEGFYGNGRVCYDINECQEDPTA